MGPKTVALFWDAAKISSIDQLAEAIEAGRLAGLPRMGAKQIEKLRKGIDDYRRSAGRFRIDVAEEEAQRIAAYLLAFPGIEKVTPAGSLRRGRETFGDLDLLATGPACAAGHTAAAVEYVAAYPGIHDIIAKGENKVSFHVSKGLQVDVRLLPSALWRRAAILHRLQGSQRLAAPARPQNGLHAQRVGAGQARRRVNRRRGHRRGDLHRPGHGLDAARDARKPWRNRGRGLAQLPRVIDADDIRGDVHMHTTASDGRNSIREMAEAALACGYRVHRHHRSFQSSRHDRRPRRQARP